MSSRQVTLAMIGMVLSISTACSDNGISVPISRPAAATFAKNDVDEYVVTPAGRYHRSCVHEVPAQAYVSRDGTIRLSNGEVHRATPCAYPIYPSHPRSSTVTPSANPTTNGYIELASVYPDSGFEFAGISAYWHVPSNPATSYSASNKVYYTFPGLETPGGRDILQPVLAYGNNGSYGGSYWTIAAWQCGSTAGCFHSPVHTVAAGDSLFGYVHHGCLWGGDEIGMQDVTSGATTGICVATVTFAWAFGGAVEAYGLTSCNEFPPTGPVFSPISLTQTSDYYNPMTPTWDHYVNTSTTPWCGYDVSSTSTTVTLAR